MSVRFEEAATEDLAMLEDSYFNPNSPFRASSIVIAALKKYESSPFWGAPAPENDLASEGFRVIYCDPYIVYYKIGENREITVYRIFHKRQDRSVFPMI